MVLRCRVFESALKIARAVCNRFLRARPARIVIVTAGITMATFLTTGLFATRSSRVGTVSAAVEKRAPDTASTARPVLGFGAETRYAALWLTWNREAAVVNNASSGVLTIEDGRSTHEFRFSAAMLHSGAFEVSPKSEFVKASLSITNAGATTREWVIALLAANRTGTSVVPRKAISPAGTKLVARAIRDRKPPPASTAPSIGFNPAPAIEHLEADAGAATTAHAVEPKTLDIVVTIDDTGRVVAGEIAAQNKVDTLFADAALDLARAWRFEPTAFPGGLREKTLHLRQPAYQ